MIRLETDFLVDMAINLFTIRLSEFTEESLNDIWFEHPKHIIIVANTCLSSLFFLYLIHNVRQDVF